MYMMVVWVYVVRNKFWSMNKDCVSRKLYKFEGKNSYVFHNGAFGYR